jgi:transposase
MLLAAQHDLEGTLRYGPWGTETRPSPELIYFAGSSNKRTLRAFASLAGASPIEASSGPVRRHRLNRGGDRQLNWALHTASLVRIRYHEETSAYYERLLDRGKTKREAIRCVKRMLCRRLYRIMVEERSLCETLQP